MEIDINDINYQQAHEELNSTFRKEKYSANFYKVLTGWAWVICKGISSILYCINNYNKDLSYDFLFISFTDNNCRTLKPIHDKMQSSKFLTIGELKTYWFWSMFISPIVFFRYITYSGYMKKVYASEFASFCYSYGVFIEAKYMLKRMKIKVLVVANDHSLHSRAFFRAAQSLNIKTAYTQHASVTENFPPLEFDYAFLDGQESYDKYTANEKICKSKVFLLGGPRFDIIPSYNVKKVTTNSITKIGLALKINDIPCKIECFVKDLREVLFDTQIVIRPHPAMDQLFWRTFTDKYGCLFSDATKENPFEYIAANDIFVSGESAFHLDVALFGKKSYFYNLTNQRTTDHYGYLKKGLIESLSDKYIELINNNKTDDISIERTTLLQFYVANYNTVNWGKSAELIKDVLLQSIVH